MWQKCKIKFANAKLSKKMFFAYALLAGIMGSMAIFVLQYSFGITNKELYEKSLQELEFFSQRVDKELEDIESLSYTLAMDAQVQAALADASNKRYLSLEYYYALRPVRKAFLNGVNSRQVVYNAKYLNKDTVCISVGKEEGEIADETYSLFMDQCSNAKGGYVSLPPSENYEYLISGRDILEVENASLRYLGTVLLTSDISGIIEEEKKNLQFSESLLFMKVIMSYIKVYRTYRSFRILQKDRDIRSSGIVENIISWGICRIVKHNGHMLTVCHMIHCSGRPKMPDLW